MKRKSILLTAALVMFAAFTATAFAVEERQADARAEKTEAAKTENGKEAKPAKKKVSRHSHPVEKGIVPPSFSGTNEEAKEPKKPIHDHRKEHKGG